MTITALLKAVACLMVKGGFTPLSNDGDCVPVIIATPHGVDVVADVLPAWEIEVGWWGPTNISSLKEIVSIKEQSPMTRLDPKYAWSNKGVALFSQGKYDEAIKCYDEAIRLDPKLAETWCNKGAALTNQGNYDEAIKACDEAIRLDPKSAIAWDVKGIAIWNQGNSADAINAFNEAIRLDPNNSEFWHHKGIVLKALGRTTEADACLCQSRRRATRV